jgi:hypothetical protein
MTLCLDELKKIVLPTAHTSQAAISLIPWLPARVKSEADETTDAMESRGVHNFSTRWI